MTGQIASKLTTNSQCTHWVNDPSPPVGGGGVRSAMTTCRWVCAVVGSRWMRFAIMYWPRSERPPVLAWNCRSCCHPQLDQTFMGFHDLPLQVRRRKYDGPSPQGSGLLFAEQRRSEWFDPTPHEPPPIHRGFCSSQECVKSLGFPILVLSDCVQEEHSDGLALGIDYVRVSSVNHGFKFLSYQHRNLLYP